MPKIKTSSSISKRFKITSKKKLIRHKASRSHLLEKKSPKRKHHLSQVIALKNCDVKRLRFKLRY